MSKDLDRKIKEVFYKADPAWRIEAVIHDGAWYTVEKWAKQARVSQDLIVDYINNTPHIIQGRTLDSYRMGKEAIEKWYKKNNLDIQERIVPRNYPPKIWAGMTESEAFELAPRRFATYLLVDNIAPNLRDRLKRIFKGRGTVVTANDKFKIYGLSGAYLKKHLIDNFTPQEVRQMKCRLQTQLLRELCDFPQEFIDDFSIFYLDFARVVLKGHQQTIELFLPEREDQNSQIYEWIWRALKKYDNTKCVPFSGYLTTVLSRWPYDLPNLFLGKDLALYQRQRKVAIQELLDSGLEHYEITNEMIANKMGMPLDIFLDFLDQHKLWDKAKNTEEYNFKETNNEREAENVWNNEQVSRDYELLHKLSLAAIKTILKTSNFEEGAKLIKTLDTDNPDLSNFSPEFINAYRNEITEVLHEI